MRKFSSRAIDWATGAAELLVRVLMCTLPIVAFLNDGVTIAVATAAFTTAFDGYLRLWGCSTSRAFIADNDGLEIISGFDVRVVPWANVLAIQTWHHFNRIDYIAVNYERAGCIEVATCASRYAEGELGSFVRACAAHVSSPVLRRSIVVAGLFDPAVHWPLLNRLAQDVVAATLFGVLLGAAGASFALGLLVASLSAWIAALRHSIRRLELLQRDGLWRFAGRDGKVPAMPRSLMLWVRSLSQVASQPTPFQEGSTTPSRTRLI
jgi:hypothetical protein